jgi:hypothetical protein
MEGEDFHAQLSALACNCTILLIEDVEAGNAGPFLGKPEGASLADAPGCTSDNRHLS